MPATRKETVRTSQKRISASLNAGDLEHRGNVKPAGTRRKPAPKALRADAAMLHVRVTDLLKQEAAKTLEAIGMTTSEAVRLFLHRVVVEQRLPLDLCVPNAKTEAAIREARDIAARPSRFTGADALFASLEKAG